MGPHDRDRVANLLASIDRQAFPKDQLEVLLQYEGNSEEARARGIERAQGEIIGCLDADNQVLGFTFLADMVRAASAVDVVGAYPSHYAWFADDPPLNRYFALLGANDPLCWWLGKADRRSWLVAPGAGTVVHRGSIPTLGSNGFFAKQAAMQPHVAAFARSHIDGCEAMRRAGFDTYTIVDAVIWHRTGTTLGAYLRKRYTYARLLSLQQRERSWRMVGSWRDLLGVAAFCLASLLVVPHLWVSIRGYRRVRDWSWFLHYFVCSTLTLVYGVALAEYLLGRIILWLILATSTQRKRGKR